MKKRTFTKEEKLKILKEVETEGLNELFQNRVFIQLVIIPGKRSLIKWAILDLIMER